MSGTGCRQYTVMLRAFLLAHEVHFVSEHVQQLAQMRCVDRPASRSKTDRGKIAYGSVASLSFKAQEVS